MSARPDSTSSKRRCLSGSGAGGEEEKTPRPHPHHRAAERLLADRDPGGSASAARNLAREYAAVIERDATVAESHSFSESLSRRAHGRNRYRDVLPYDANRVRLPPPLQGGGRASAAAAAATAAHAAANSNSSDYINASHVAILLSPPEPKSTGEQQGEGQDQEDALIAAAMAAVAPPTPTATAGATAPSSSAVARYVATQGPLPSTSADFWAMVAALGSPAVVMLTNAVERGVPKCHPYFPTEAEEEGGDGDERRREATAAANGANGNTNTTNKREMHLPSRNLSVRCVRVSHGVPPEAAPPLASSSSPSAVAAAPAPARGAVTVRRLQLRCASSGRVLHELDHYHLHAWPDHGVPAGGEGGAPVRALCRALELSRQRRASRQRAAATEEPPVVVHCSAGIGRTGTFCAVDVLLRRMWALGGGSPPRKKKGEEDGDNKEAAAATTTTATATTIAPPPLSPLLLDVPSLVLALRAQRAGMVQTLEQYAYVGAAALEEAAALAAGAAPPLLTAVEEEEAKDNDDDGDGGA